MDRRVLVAERRSSFDGGPAPAPASTPVSPSASPSASAAKIERGIVTGRLIDKQSGQPLASVGVTLIGTAVGARTDLDGNFRIVAPVGIYVARAAAIGYAPARMDSVRVTAGATVTANFALKTVSVELESMKIQAPPTRATSEDALLSLQKSAPRVSDGISAEAIKRAPGASASDAIVRVTGVSIVDKKFAVVRGLAEWYSNTLLNGVELPSPEPLKKIVPLDLFPSSLLQSIVVTKTATPDRPGDFAGGSVEVSTKEFPDTQIAEMSLSLGYGSRSTFQSVSKLPQHGIDFFGFDSGNRRAMPANPPANSADPASERLSEQLRNVWTPAPTKILPDLGMGLNLGDRFGSETSPLGYAVALTYSRKTDFSPDRFSQLVFDSETGVAKQGYTAHESTTRVDVGTIVNLSARMGPSTKFGWKNLFTRNAEEMLSRNPAFETYNGSLERLTYQVRYITRNLFQTQLTGDHLIDKLFHSRLEWKGTLATSARDEPENRSLIYFKQVSDGRYLQTSAVPSPYWFRFLDDKTKMAQFDWGVPLGDSSPTVRT